MTGRPMRGIVVIAGDVLDDTTLEQWIAQARSRVWLVWGLGVEERCRLVADVWPMSSRRIGGLVFDAHGERVLDGRPARHSQGLR